jgi:hypothetical protein
MTDLVTVLQAMPSGTVLDASMLTAPASLALQVLRNRESTMSAASTWTAPPRRDEVVATNVQFLMRAKYA